jgi:hypothetical protein
LHYSFTNPPKTEAAEPESMYATQPFMTSPGVYRPRVTTPIGMLSY